MDQPTFERLSPLYLNVGGKVFVTTETTVSKSVVLLTAFRSRHHPGGHPQIQGALFFDASPEMFVHILQFLRRGTIPDFRTAGDDHDIIKYKMLLDEARFFQIAMLVELLESSSLIQPLYDACKEVMEEAQEQQVKDHRVDLDY